MIKLIIAVVLAGFAGYQYSESSHAQRVVELNKAIYALGVVIQMETNISAETNRQLKVSNQGRINAIKIKDHASVTVKRLQSELDNSINDMATLRDNYDYIVVNVGSIARVYNQSRRECRGLPDTSDTSIVSAQLSEFTGDSVAEVVRYLAGQYCAIATDYNSLYLTTEKLLAQ